MPDQKPDGERKGEMPDPSEELAAVGEKLHHAREDVKQARETITGQYKEIQDKCIPLLCLLSSL